MLPRACGGMDGYSATRQTEMRRGRQVQRRSLPIGPIWGNMGKPGERRIQGNAQAIGYSGMSEPPTRRAFSVASTDEGAASGKGEGKTGGKFVRRILTLCGGGLALGSFSARCLSGARDDGTACPGIVYSVTNNTRSKPSPFSRRRHALELWNRHSPALILTGGGVGRHHRKQRWEDYAKSAVFRQRISGKPGRTTSDR